MKKFLLGLIASVILLIGAFVLFGNTLIGYPTPSETYRDIDGNIMDRWIWGGAEAEIIDATVEKIKAATGEREVPEQFDTIKAYGPGHWTYEFVQVGNDAIARGEAAQAQGDTDAAREAFYKASAYYQIAKFPFTRTDQYVHYLDAYKKSMAAYERAGQYFPVPLEVLELPYEDGVVRGYLHLVPGALQNAAPLVMLSGGIDTLKVEHHPIVEALNARGMSALVIDLPGVGESNYVDATPAHDEVFSRFLDLVTPDPRIDERRVGIWAASWGGNAAAKIAFVDPRFKAAASVCGPVHEVFSPPWWVPRFVPNLTRHAVPAVVLDVAADRVGLPAPLSNDDAVEISRRMLPFSLRAQGFVGGDKKATVPLLIINTTDDPVAPPEDMEALADYALDADVHYTGQGGHCGSRIPLVEKSVPWLAEHLVTDVK